MLDPDGVRALEAFRSMEAADVQNDRRTAWALRYGMLECIQIVIDIACSVVSRHGLGYPDSYAECISELGTAGYIGPALSKRLQRAVGMRNIIVPDYLEVSDQILFEALNRLSDFEAFAAAMLRADG